jgi:methyl-accepting chemotaxis protein
VEDGRRAAVGGEARPAERDALASQVAEALDVLRVLEAQITDASGQAERAVVEVCGGFQRIADHARALGALGQDLEAQDGLVGVLAAARATCETLLARLEQNSARAEAVVARMAAVEDGIREVQRTVRRVEQIATSTRLLALNATIEAARSGRYGRGFAVVATEITHLADASRRTSQDIAAGIARVRDDVHGCAAQVGELAGTGRREAERSRGEVQAALEALAAGHAALRALVTRSVDGSEQVARDIARAVRGLQFQDAMSQRLGHVVHGVAGVVARLAPMVAHVRRGGAALAALAGSYTMAAERRVQQRQAGGTAAAEGTGAEGHVELF